MNTSTICLIEVTRGDEIKVSLTEDYTKPEKPFIYATIERLENDDPVETFSVADAELLHEALGEALSEAKKAVTEAIASIEAA